jgi:hypothetical protein
LRYRLEAAKKAFAYFRDRHPDMTVQTDDILIALREDGGDMAQ